MDTQFSTTPAVSSGSFSTATSDVQARQGFLGALAAALRTGDVSSAQQALNGLRGVGGGVSPGQLFNNIENAIISGKGDQIKAASTALDNYRSGATSAQAEASTAPIPGQQKALLSGDPTAKQVLPGSGLGVFINCKA